jgi:bacterioferritin-associated ferredoxin
MLNDMHIERGLAKQCGLCGRVTDLFELPGMPEKLCWECSANFATVAQLSTEIGAATQAGTSTDTLESELSETSRRILERTQSAAASEV